MNIIFDIGCVLSSFKWRSCCYELGFSEAAVNAFGERLFKSHRWDAFDLSIEGREVLIEKYRPLFEDFPEEYDTFWQHTDNMADQFEYSVNWIKSLKEQGHMVYLLSNYPDFMFKAHSRRWDFLQYTDGRAVSYEYHIMKPDPRIYQILLDKYSLDPKDCVFLDDRPENIEGAEKEGIHGILFESYEKASALLQQYCSENENSKNA